MASNNIDDEKPNLRPTKHLTASGKSLFLHHNPNAPSNKSYIHATWNKNDQEDQFGIHQPHIEYSLNKRQRWKILNHFHPQNADNQSSSSSDNDLNTQSDSEQHRRKYRLYEFDNHRQTSNCIQIPTQQHLNTPRKTYHEELTPKFLQNRSDNDNKTDITYFALIPSSRKNQLTNIRKHRGTKSKKSTLNTQRTKFTRIKEQSDESEQNFSSDEDESITFYHTRTKSDKLQLNDFIPIASTDTNNEISSPDTLLKSHPKPINRFPRQISTEEKLSNPNKTTHLTIEQKKPDQTIKSKENLMPLAFRPVLLYQSDSTIEYLSKTYGKNFIHAQCYPTKYLISLNDRLKSFPWSMKFDSFSTRQCYLIIIFNDNKCNLQEENIRHGQVALNMDLSTDTIEIENLSQTTYKIDELITKTIEFIINLSLNLCQSIDLEITQRKVLQNDIDKELSDSEFINRHIHQIQLVDKKDLQVNNNNNNISIDDYDLIRPEICTNCCSDMNDLTPMTALKSCAHWLCNQCWKQYLETSIKSIKIIVCPEWNCSAIVDVGTILSLVNVRCMNIYERNIEKCLVNISRSYVKCPSKSCSNIVRVIGSGIDNIRCRCGHQFCIDCKQEPHFPATCSSYVAYIDEVYRNGDLVSDYNAQVHVEGRNCISCNEFIQKNGGCNHMTCRCSAQFCWICTGYWKDHYTSNGQFSCPKPAIRIQKKILTKERNPSRRLYEHALYHRIERAFQNQVKQNENVKRLIGTIPLDKGNSLDSSSIKSQITKRETLLQHCYEMIKYINYLHRVCEFVAVAADGYANNPIEFTNSLYPLETLIFNLTQILEGGRGYKAIEQLNDLHKTSEKLIQRLRQAVIRRQLHRINPTGYTTA